MTAQNDHFFMAVEVDIPYLYKPQVVFHNTTFVSTNLLATFMRMPLLCFEPQYVQQCLLKFIHRALNTIGKALIAQNKGGGHGELGYHLALKLIEKDISVTVLQDGAGKNKEKQPFARYCTSLCFVLTAQYNSSMVEYSAEYHCR